MSYEDFLRDLKFRFEQCSDRSRGLRMRRNDRREDFQDEEALRPRRLNLLRCLNSGSTLDKCIKHTRYQLRNFSPATVRFRIELAYSDSRLAKLGASTTFIFTGVRSRSLAKLHPHLPFATV